jgi:glycosyltransferase involved in cell wall biosynthesis
MIGHKCSSGQSKIGKRSVTVITFSPSPYQVELFDAIAARGEINLHVVYLYTHDRTRHWQTRIPNHSHAFAHDFQGKTEVWRSVVLQPDLLVINYYRHKLAAAAIRTRTAVKRPWCFWGERPRIHPLSRISSVYRKWKLKALHRSNAPIWAMGHLAISAYKAEFGHARQYVNLPYFSDLTRFEASPNRLNGRSAALRTFLFSGTLSRRKGFDLVVDAFAQLVRDGLPVRLLVMGYGELEYSSRKRLAAARNQVEWIGFRDWEQLPQSYQNADFLCVPSRYDGWGLVVPEGLAAGLPVISTIQTGAAVEFIKQGLNGWLIQPSSQADLYKVMQFAASTTTLQLALMSEQARSSIANHTLTNGVRRFLDATKEAEEVWHLNDA